jgi:hypothetical protein
MLRIFKKKTVQDKKHLILLTIFKFVQYINLIKNVMIKGL